MLWSFSKQNCRMLLGCGKKNCNQIIVKYSCSNDGALSRWEWLEGSCKSKKKSVWKPY